MEKVIVFTHNLLADNFAKTCHGLLRGSDRFDILAVIDSANGGKDAGEVLDGRHLDIPVFHSVEAFFHKTEESPKYCVVGVAFPGGMLPEPCRTELIAAMKNGLSIVCGLHQILGDDPEFRSIANENKVELIDIRKPRLTTDLHFWSGKIMDVDTPIIAMLGTDCAIGKRTTGRFIAEACNAIGIKTEMIYTGQTGWMQGYKHGFIFDATPNDFVSGEIERVILECVRESKPDLILIEGQSSLRNPSGPCGSEFILSGNVKGVILMHAPGREFFVDMEEIGAVLPGCGDEIKLINHYGAEVLGVGLNEEGIEMDELKLIREKLNEDLGIPVVSPLSEGVDALVEPIKKYINEYSFC